MRSFFARLFLPLATAATLATLGACSPSMNGDTMLEGTSTAPMTLIKIRNENVSGITPETTYGEKSIEAALPGYTTEGIQTAVEDNTEWATAVFHTDGFQILQVFKGKDGKVREVHGTSPLLTGPNGERIGQTFYDIGMNRRDCRVGRNLWRGMAICRVKDAPNVQLVFAIPGYDGPYNQLPPDIALQDSELQRILWRPHAG